MHFLALLTGFFWEDRILVSGKLQFAGIVFVPFNSSGGVVCGAGRDVPPVSTKNRSVVIRKYRCLLDSAPVEKLSVG